ncbi:MAG: hypothetical protein V2B18_15895 [Pseudomonadota bacterium]
MWRAFLDTLCMMSGNFFYQIIVGSYDWGYAARISLFQAFLFVVLLMRGRFRPKPQGVSENLRHESPAPEKETDAP